MIQLAHMLTTQDVAELFHRSPVTIVFWTKNVGLPYIRIPGRRRDSIRYDQEAVVQWAISHHKRIYLNDDVRGDSSGAPEVGAVAAG